MNSNSAVLHHLEDLYEPEDVHEPEDAHELEDTHELEDPDELEGEQLMDPQTLRRELEARGLQLLGIGRHHSRSEILVVYLHGNAGQWRDGAARLLIASVPGVLSVSESVQSASILLVWVSLADADRPVGRSVDLIVGSPDEDTRSVFIQGDDDRSSAGHSGS